MTEHQLEPPLPELPDGEADAQGVDSAVAQFLELAESGHTDLEGFCASQPAEVRAVVRSACRSALVLNDVITRGRGELRGERPGSLPPDTPGPPGSPGLPRSREGRWIGEYEILEEIGRGGMGVVYLARQSSLDRRVALKVLPFGATLLNRQVERFRREARAVARLSHPGIVPVLAVGEAEGVHHFAMEYVEGESLHARLERLRGEVGAGAGSANGAARAAAREISRSVHTARAAELAAEVAHALDYAHGQGVVHRDVKPQNVLIDGSGRARLVDFGLAKATGTDSLSWSGDLAGTPCYMSPEQAQTKAGPVGSLSDVYSLGVVLYEMLTLRRPFEGESLHQVLFDIAHKDAAGVRRLNPRVPKDLETICAKAMEKRPEDRYQSAAAMAADLERFVAHEAIAARPPSGAELLARRLRRHPGIVLAVALAAIAVTGTWIVAGRLAEGRTLDRDWRGIERWTELAPDELAGLDAAELAFAQRSAAELRARHPDLKGRAERLAELEAELRELGRTHKERALELVARDTETPSDTTFHAAQEALYAARALLPADPDLEELVDPRATRPRLTVVSDAGGDQVWLTRIDPLTGAASEPELLGITPIEAEPVLPALYRIVVVRAGVGWAELTRSVDRRRFDHRFEACVRSTAEVTAGMAHVRAGPFHFGIPGSDFPVYGERVEYLPDFWIDKTEVSNAEYRRFCEETGHRPPAFWQQAWDSTWDDRPVVGVSYTDAQSYAEWAGKRLPTHSEWEKAARGSDGRTVPWDGPPEDAPERAVVGGDNRGASAGDSLEAAFALYAQHVAPVAGGRGEPGPAGLWHTLGNVAEWTETPFVRLTPDLPTPMMEARILKGGGWDLPRKNWDLSGVDSGLTDVSRVNTIGFRCAKSAREPE